MFIAGLAFLFLVIYSALKGYPSADDFKLLPVADANVSESTLVGTYRNLLLLDGSRVVHLASRFVVCIQSGSQTFVGDFVRVCGLGATALGNLLLWIGPSYVQRLAHLAMLGSVLCRMFDIDGCKC